MPVYSASRTDSTQDSQLVRDQLLQEGEASSSVRDKRGQTGTRPTFCFTLTLGTDRRVLPLAPLRLKIL